MAENKKNTPAATDITPKKPQYRRRKKAKPAEVTAEVKIPVSAPAEPKKPKAKKAYSAR